MDDLDWDPLEMWDVYHDDPASFPECPGCGEPLETPEDQDAEVHPECAEEVSRVLYPEEEGGEG